MANVRSKLGNRIYFPDSTGQIVIPPDDDKWRQCHRCGKIYPRYEAKQEAELTSLTEPGDNPFKFGNGQIRAVGDSRKFDRTGRTQRKRKFKQDLSEYKEEDVKEALRKGAKLVSYEEYRIIIVSFVKEKKKREAKPLSLSRKVNFSF
jgi:hypothetical protein